MQTIMELSVNGVIVEHNWKERRKKKVLVAAGASMLQLISHMGHLLLARSSQTTFGESVLLTRKNIQVNVRKRGIRCINSLP